MTMAGILGWLFPAKTRDEEAVVEEVAVRIGVRGHEGAPLVITKLTRCEHVIDALFDDTRLEGGLRRIELTTDAITLTFDARCPKELREIATKRLPDLLAAPRFVVDE
jgi:hypothetical protein